MKHTKALNTSATLRYSTFGALYFAQGIPQGFQLYAIPAWMAMNGMDAATIGAYVGICTLPWAFKIIAGPLMDRYTFLPMGRRRSWLLTAQLGLLIMMLVMAFVPDPLNNMSVFMAVSFVLNCFGAVQDVATDGLAVDITPVGEQARANGIMWGSKVVGIGITLTVGTWLINKYGFELAVVCLTIAMLLVLVLPSILRERQGERMFPWSKGDASPETLGMKVETWGEILYTLKSAFLLRNSVIGAVCMLMGGVVTGLKDAMLPVFTIQQLGWDNAAYADLVAGANVIGAVAAMVLAGWIADRVGKIRIISIYILLMAVAWIVLATTSHLWILPNYVPALVYGIQFFETFCLVAILATAMNLCWRRVAATQFTLYMVCNNVGLVVGAMLLGPLHARFDWSGMFMVLAGMLLLALVLWQFTRLGVHQVSLEKLETLFAKKAEAKSITLIPDLGVPVSVV